MGTYFYYVNQSKRELFPIDPSGMEIKRYAIGANIGSRAFSYLLLDNNEHHSGIPNHQRIGSWIGDHVFITGDDYRVDFPQLIESYSNISGDVLDMLSVVAPGDFYSAGGKQWLLDYARLNVEMTDAIRRRLLTYYRNVNQQFPNAELQAVIKALRPKTE